eukprot:SAG11_NODE_2938_length_2822_cov_388.174807_3_plen_159_part_00
MRVGTSDTNPVISMDSQEFWYWESIIEKDPTGMNGLYTMEKYCFYTTEDSHKFHYRGSHRFIKKGRVLNDYLTETKKWSTKYTDDPVWIYNERGERGLEVSDIIYVTVTPIQDSDFTKSVYSTYEYFLKATDDPIFLTETGYKIFREGEWQDMTFPHQ